MGDEEIKVFPLGDSAITVEFGRSISIELNSMAIALAARIEALKFPGFIEAVPAFASTTIYYDPHVVRQHFGSFPSASAAVRHIVCQEVLSTNIVTTARPRFHEVPVYFDKDAALDMDDVCRRSGLTHDDVIEVFTSQIYRVFMLGFLPGFAYLGTVDERLEMPRRSSPRSSVPKGSIGIAGRHTGIYPSVSPGGWQIIGRTELEMLLPGSMPPCLFEPGDQVRFVIAK